MFNGSASLRDAAGQMIENVTKSVRRKQTVDDAYFDRMFSEVNSLYRLDQRGSNAAEREDLGPLPAGAKALLGGLVLVWICIAGVFLRQKLRSR